MTHQTPENTSLKHEPYRHYDQMVDADIEEKIDHMRWMIDTVNSRSIYGDYADPATFIGISSDYVTRNPFTKLSDERTKLRKYTYMGESEGSDIYETVEPFTGGKNNRQQFERILRFDTAGNTQRIIVSHWDGPPKVENNVPIEEIIDGMLLAADAQGDEIRAKTDQFDANRLARKNEKNLAKRALNRLKYNDVPLRKK